MTSESIRRQDASALMPLGVFRDGVLLEVVPASDPYGYATRDKYEGHAEVLLLCHLHPDQSAVDCLTCEPV